MAKKKTFDPGETCSDLVMRIAAEGFIQEKIETILEESLWVEEIFENLVDKGLKARTKEITASINTVIDQIDWEDLVRSTIKARF